MTAADSSVPVRRWRGPLPWWALAVFAAVGGLSASASFAPFGWAPCAIVAVAILTWCVRSAHGLGGALIAGACFGLAFMGTSLIWQTEIMVASYAGLVAATSLVFVGVSALTWWMRSLPAWPLFAAASWSASEWVISVFPFGGFGWMRLGYTQLDTPMAGLYPLVGAAGVTFVVAVLGTLLAAVIQSPGVRSASALVWVVVAVLAAGGLGSFITPTSHGSVDVGWVQGGAPGGGVYGLGPARSITYNSRDETAALMRRVAAGDVSAPQFIAWPENSTDMDPRTDVATRRAVESAVDNAGVPILVGSIFEDPAAQTRQTVAVWWTPAGGDLVYAKRNLVPFGEWIPGRDLLMPLIPQLSYVGADSVPGTTPGEFVAALPDGRDLPVGVAICYEVIFPQTLNQAVEAGAQVLIVQSSNAMYQGTNQIAQQFTITRVRAAEMRRTIQVVTTSGVSGLIGPQGQVLRQAPDSVAASGVDTLPLETTPPTPAMRIQPWLEYGVTLMTGLGVVWVLLRHLRGRRGGRMDAVAAHASA